MQPLPRGSFSPPRWGGSGNLGIISPPESETLGGKFEIFPPQNPRPWGGNFTISPPRWGGRARRRRKILRILTPEMIEILKKNAFPTVKMAGKPQKFPACGGLFSPPQQYFFIKTPPKSPKKIRLRRAYFIEICLVMCLTLKFFSRLRRAIIVFCVLCLSTKRF